MSPAGTPLSRITADPQIFGGKPIIRGMRIWVETVLGLLAQGAPLKEILDDYPDLVEDDIRACLAYARAVIAEDRLERKLSLCCIRCRGRVVRSSDFRSNR